MRSTHPVARRPRPRFGRNSCSGGSSSLIVTGRPPSPRTCPSKSDRWNGNSRRARASRRLVLGEDHLAARRQPLFAEEHVLGAAEPDALRAETRARVGVVRRVGVRAHSELSVAIRPREDRLQVGVQPGLDQRCRADDHPPVRAVHRDRVALADRDTADRCSGRRARRSSSAAQPATHGLPIPRATTAAWEAIPP